MANRIRGEVEVKALGETYTLLLDFNALCELEDEFPGLMTGEATISGFKSLRRIFHVGFSEHHGDLTERDVGGIIHDIGIEVAAQKMAEAMKASFPTAAAKTPATKGRAKPGIGDEA
ncbi:hypothetical protein ACFPIF_00100 [Brevundimonas faecalis]|uniref:hypothetical protein n=1 Tax=Brevundimonas faecalis TaxID=947378 RepID=UPI0036180F50